MMLPNGARRRATGSATQRDRGTGDVSAQPYVAADRRAAAQLLNIWPNARSRRL